VHVQHAVAVTDVATGKTLPLVPGETLQLSITPQGQLLHPV
jgi:hypothetical protein